MLAKNSGKLFVISAPAGTGKTTLVKRFLKEHKNFRQSISLTTRPQRPGEKEGVDYYFVDVPNFEQTRQAGHLLEFVHLFDHFYGTSKQKLEEQLNRGYHVILVIDTQGAIKIKTLFPATLIFIRPPSLEELKKRLEGRHTEAAQMRQKRLDHAAQEIKDSVYYHHCIVNQDLDQAYQDLKDIIDRSINS